MNFPTLCVDNFFNDPDHIRNWALSLPFYKCGDVNTVGIWPGYRTQELHLIDRKYFEEFSKKVLSLFFGLHTNFEYVISTHFQKINSNFFNGIDSGWIHADGDAWDMAGVIYLNPIIDKNNGTSIFASKLTSYEQTLKEIGQYINYKQEMYANFKTENTEIYKKMKEKNNSLFEKTIEFHNVYNRLIAYDSHWHMESGFKMPKDEDRLTQVFFVKNLKNVWSPIQCSKEINL
jgi:hypothetical protein